MLVWIFWMNWSSRGRSTRYEKSNFGETKWVEFRFGMKRLDICDLEVFIIFKYNHVTHIFCLREHVKGSAPCAKTKVKGSAPCAKTTPTWLPIKPVVTSAAAFWKKAGLAGCQIGGHETVAWTGEYTCPDGTYRGGIQETGNTCPACPGDMEMLDGMLKQLKEESTQTWSKQMITSQDASLDRNHWHFHSDFYCKAATHWACYLRRCINTTYATECEGSQESKINRTLCDVLINVAHHPNAQTPRFLAAARLDEFGCIILAEARIRDTWHLPRSAKKALLLFFLCCSFLTGQRQAGLSVKTSIRMS